jgi:hypothetical protein
MRTLLLSIAAAASSIALAAPASAQWVPQPQGYGYGHHNPYNYGQLRNLMTRIDRLQRDIYRMDQRGRLSSRDAARLYHSAEQLRQRVVHASYNGLSRRERLAFDHRVQRLRSALRQEISQNRRYYGRNDSYRRSHQRWHQRHDRRR